MDRVVDSVHELVAALGLQGRVAEIEAEASSLLAVHDGIVEAEALAIESNFIEQLLLAEQQVCPIGGDEFHVDARIVQQLDAPRIHVRIEVHEQHVVALRQAEGEHVTAVRFSTARIDMHRALVESLAFWALDAELGFHLISPW